MRWGSKGRLFLALAIWFAGAFVWVGGLYAASARCHDLVYDLPREGMGVRTPNGFCEVYDVDGTVLERWDIDDRDATEFALVMAGLGAGLLVGGRPAPRGRRPGHRRSWRPAGKSVEEG